MYRNTLSVLAVLLSCCFLQAVHAGIHFNAPVGKTTWDASKPQTVKWRESGILANRTTLTMLGQVSISLYAGSNTNGKSQIASLGTVSATAEEFQVNIPTNVGSNGGVYFIRLASTTLTDKIYDSNKFTLSGMTGAFNVTVQRAIGSTNGNVTSSGPTFSSLASNTRASSTSSPTSGASQLASASAALIALPVLALLASSAL